MLNHKERVSLNRIIMPPDVKEKLENPSKGDLRVWWIPNKNAGRPFHIPVFSPMEAKLVLDTLARYDAFQYLQNIKGDYANAGGLQQYLGAEHEEDDGWEDDDGWCEWVFPEFTELLHHPELAILAGEEIGEISSSKLNILTSLQLDWSTTAC